MHPKDLHLSDTKTAQQKMMRLKIPGGCNVLSLSHTSQYKVVGWTKQQTGNFAIVCMRMAQEKRADLRACH